MRFCADRRSAGERGAVRMRNELDAMRCNDGCPQDFSPVLILPTHVKTPLLPPPLISTPADDSEGLYQSRRSSKAIPLSSSPSSF